MGVASGCGAAIARSADSQVSNKRVAPARRPAREEGEDYGEVEGGRPVSPKRLDRVAPPPVEGERDVRFGTAEAAKGRTELCAQFAGNTRGAFEPMRANPRPPGDATHYQLGGGLSHPRLSGPIQGAVAGQGQRQRPDLVLARRREAHRVGHLCLARASEKGARHLGHAYLLRERFDGRNRPVSQSGHYAAR
jgi:hypothetical protein